MKSGDLVKVIQDEDNSIPDQYIGLIGIILTDDRAPMRLKFVRENNINHKYWESFGSVITFRHLYFYKKNLIPWYSIDTLLKKVDILIKEYEKRN